MCGYCFVSHKRFQPCEKGHFLPKSYRITPSGGVGVQDPVSLTTVSSAFIDDWLTALSNRCSAPTLASLLKRSGVQTAAGQRITLTALTTLYQYAVVETGDEMMGLWSRPIRPRALQHLVSVLRDAGSQTSALYRFTTFWNLLLDDFQLHLETQPNQITLSLHATETDITPQRFGHMLILKLAHGLLSWLGGVETPVVSVRFAFDKPPYASDYAVVFPCPVEFNAAQTSIAFNPNDFTPPLARSTADAAQFLERAPLDWIFTASRAHSHSLRVRAYIYGTKWSDAQLQDAAKALNMTVRTLNRRLQEEGTSFQSIKDDLRRDMAIRALQHSTDSIDKIAYMTGFSAAANFHRAFRSWTNRTPGSYRVQGRGIG